MTMLEIERKKWTLLRDLYQLDRENLTGYDLISSYIHWNVENVKIYTTNANWREHGTFILIHSFDNKLDIYMNTLNGTLDELHLALKSMQLNLSHLICGYGNGLKETVEQYWLGKGLSLDQLQHQGTFVYHLPRSAIQPFDAGAKSDIVFAPLCKKHHAVVVNEHWAYRSDDSLQLIGNLIEYNLSAGAFDKEGRLLAWCLRSTHGSLSHLHVLPAYRRLGLASFLIHFMAHEITATGSEVLATIVFSNEISRKLFERLGFKHISDIYWAFVPPTI